MFHLVSSITIIVRAESKIVTESKFNDNGTSNLLYSKSRGGHLFPLNPVGKPCQGQRAFWIPGVTCSLWTQSASSVWGSGCSDSRGDHLFPLNPVGKLRLVSPRHQYNDPYYSNGEPVLGLVVTIKCLSLLKRHQYNNPYYSNGEPVLGLVDQ